MKILLLALLLGVAWPLFAETPAPSVPLPEYLENKERLREAMERARLRKKTRPPLPKRDPQKRVPPGVKKPLEGKDSPNPAIIPAETP